MSSNYNSELLIILSLLLFKKKKTKQVWITFCSLQKFCYRTGTKKWCLKCLFLLKNSFVHNFLPECLSQITCSVLERLHMLCTVIKQEFFFYCLLRFITLVERSIQYKVLKKDMDSKYFIYPLNIPLPS